MKTDESPKCCNQYMEKVVSFPFDLWDNPTVDFYCECCDKQIDGGEISW